MVVVWILQIASNSLIFGGGTLTKRCLACPSLLLKLTMRIKMFR